MEGAGNVRFALKTYDAPLHLSDVSQDVVDFGIIANVARYLASKGLYPRA